MGTSSQVAQYLVLRLWACGRGEENGEGNWQGKGKGNGKVQGKREEREREREGKGERKRIGCPGVVEVAPQGATEDHWRCKASLLKLGVSVGKDKGEVY